jgi:hypothetical protein
MAVQGAVLVSVTHKDKIFVLPMGSETLEETMKAIMIAALTCLSLAFVSDAALAAGKKKASAPAKCTTGQMCAANCNPAGWCARMVCVGGKWERRLTGCWGAWCGPRCS